jgi:hypothetical protein
MIGDNIINALRAHPWALALVVVNVLFLSYIVHEVAASGERRDQLIAELARECGRTPKGDKQ